MNLATILIVLALVPLYGLAIRSICRQGACADCGARAVCPAHQLRAKGLRRPNAKTLAKARQAALQSERPALIIQERKS